ncbi:MAG: hypothetical protein HZB40_17770 [Rhodocyclales bacterium]|nr:hypothetical protein [Rhodocyclales bacterium]
MLEKVGARATAVSDTDVEIFWFMHRERFRRPETRRLRHILVTINDSQPGSEPEAARARIEAIEARVQCDAIEPASTLSLSEATARIRQYLEQQRRGICQKSWINALRRQAVAG